MQENKIASNILKGAAIGGAFMVPVAGLPLAIYLAKRLYGKPTPEQINKVEKKLATHGFKKWLGQQES